MRRRVGLECHHPSTSQLRKYERVVTISRAHIESAGRGTAKLLDVLLHLSLPETEEKPCLRGKVNLQSNPTSDTPHRPRMGSPRKNKGLHPLTNRHRLCSNVGERPWRRTFT